ncbi:MAG: hypothetical protein KDE27_14640 [Planctomycetes bacterium]|nr:hypothetical protein [Planctomycetota bacterium]
MKSVFPLLVALALGVAARCPAQHLELESSLVPIHTQEDDGGVAYGTWAAGARYKVAFENGATFVPYLGRSYPALRPFAWRTRSVRIGETEVAVGAPRFRHGDYRAEFDRGGVVEAYDVRADGLEQTFVIATRPAGVGDLVIRGDVATELVADARAGEHAAVDFRDADGNAIVRYGAATAVDAAGDRQPMTTAFGDGILTLRLDAAWLAAASYPIVVDPLLGNIFSVTDTDVVEQVDLLRDDVGAQGNNWRVAVRWAAANDADIGLRRFDDDGTGNTLVYSDTTAAWSTPDCSIGLQRHNGIVLLAFTRLLSTGVRALRVHQHSRGNFSLSSQLVGVNTGSSQAWRPDVGTDLAFAAPRSLLIVFQQENTPTFVNTTTSEIWGVIYDMANQTAGTPFLIAGQPLEDHERPTAGKIRTPTRPWTVAYEVLGAGALWSPHVDTDLELRRVDRAGNVGAETVLGLGNGWHDLAPRLGGFDDVQIVAYPRSRVSVVGSNPSGDNGMEIVTRRHDWDGTTWTQPYGSYRHAVNPDPRVVLTGIDMDTTTNSHYVLSYRSTATENVYVRTIGYRGYLTRLETLFTAGAGDQTISGAVAYDVTNERFLVAYGANRPLTNYTNVDGFVHPSALPPVHGGLGCSAGQLDWVGSQLIGDDDCQIVLDNIPAGALATVIVGTQPLNQLLVGVPIVHAGCWLLVPNTGVGSLATMPVGFGPSVSYRIDLPEWLGPFDLHFQGVHFDAGNTEVFTTDRLTVPLVK